MKGLFAFLWAVPASKIASSLGIFHLKSPRMLRYIFVEVNPEVCSFFACQDVSWRISESVGTARQSRSH